MTVYKLVRPGELAEWQASGPAGWAGSPDDQRDGFVHLSTEVQVAGTLARHFHDAPAVYLVPIPEQSLPPGGLRFEPSRDGERFPHLYGLLPAALATGATPIAPGR
jgi:uncharacterized protein (DUF952 family)